MPPAIREKRQVTRLMIILSLLEGRRKLKEIAENIDVTVQAVSEYMKEMAAEGLVTPEGTVTVRGIEFAEDMLAEIKAFVDYGYRVLEVVQVTAAIAEEEVKKGDRVYLFVEDGFLRAYRTKEGASSGVAMADASPGEDVPVADLRGIAEHVPGKVILVVLPSPREGGSRTVAVPDVVEVLKGAEKVFVVGEVAKGFAHRAGMEVEDFGGVQGAYEAAVKGINTAAILSREYLKFVLREIEDMERRFPGVRWRVVDFSGR
jgi:putative transcriptional regulator